MRFYYHENKAKKILKEHGSIESLYLHNPKTGGTSIECLVNKYKLGNKIIQSVYHMDVSFWKYVLTSCEIDWNSIFKFTFVRNPWDKLVSSYLHQGARKAKWKDCLDFEGFEHYVLSLSGFGKQHRFTHIDGKLEVDFVGKFENYTEDISYVFKKIGLEEYLENFPHKRKNTFEGRRPHFSHYYSNARVRNKVRPFLSEDANLFGYEIL
jgi:hypothetical protein